MGSVNVHLVDMSGMGTTAAMVSRPGGQDMILMLEETLSLREADDLIHYYLTPEQLKVRVIHCSCAAPTATPYREDVALGA